MHRERPPLTPRRRVTALLAGLLLAVVTPTAAVAHAGHEADGIKAGSAVADRTFVQIPLAKGPDQVGEPMSLAVLPDRSVLHTSRDGTLFLTGQAGSTRVAGKLPVYSHDEEGLQGVGVDPDFKNNRAIYLYYAPKLNTPAGDAPGSGSADDFAKFDGVNRLSRFVLNDDGTLDLDSEKKVLDVPASRGVCCHVGGDIDFDKDGNLYLSTGDDTNPFASDGYTPIDDSPNRNPAFDARRSAGNTNDLRGKILRIKVAADGSYTIPDGNLFPPGTDKTRPEIYAMGLRNPFRMSVDKQTGVVYVGDFGPDAAAADPNRGPGGQVEFNRITKPGNFGWPFCTGKNDAYVDYDFATQKSGSKFDCGAPKNNSRFNTGLADLPPAQPAWIPYDGGSVPEFNVDAKGNPGSESPIGGPVYRYDENSTSSVKFPKEYDGNFFAGEYGRQWIKRIEQGDDGTVQKINAFPWTGTQVMDMAFGPDGALYVLDYGTGSFGGDANSALYRIEYAKDGLTPIAEVSADHTDGAAPLQVSFTGKATDGDSQDLTYAWDFGDGTKGEGLNPTHTYEKNGTYQATFTATDPEGHVGSANVRVVVGNTKPTVEIITPTNGSLYHFGDPVPFKVKVTDPDEPDIDCSKVTVRFSLGHDNHAHELSKVQGCEGTLTPPKDGEHDPDANIFGLVGAEYTDNGAGGQAPLTGKSQVTLPPYHRQAEYFTTQSGNLKLYDKAGAHGGKTVGDSHDGDWISFDPYRLTGATKLKARISSGGAGGTLELHTGSPTGPLHGSIEVKPTGSWENFADVETTLKDVPDQTTKIYLVFKGGSGALFDLDDFEFTTDGSGGAHTGEVKGVNGKCMDVAGGKDDDETQVQLYGCNNTAAQQWTLPGDGTIRALGKCLDVQWAGTDDGTKIQLYHCNDTVAQQWVPQGDGTVRNPNSGKCLDAEGDTWGDETPIHLWTCHGKANQQWTLP
ncbi:PQQ-dependent sugar dehydrogenase [Streptomyces mirabilis]|uniref:PQQ-dependent sugar dehydrogenase n=1 Tax=Streptomyces mirabilis TaxID=68239 RepID=UPI0036B17577